MAKSGKLGWKAPDDGDQIIRRIEAIEDEIRLLRPSVAQSVKSIVAALIVGAWANQQDQPGFTLGTSSSLATFTSTTLHVPDGYTRGIIVATAWVYASNGSGATDYLQAGVKVDSESPAWLTVNPATPNGSSASTQVIEIAYLDGLTPGGEVTVRGVASSYGATPWGTNTNGYVQAFGLFFV